jgi:hypothetical protein
MRVVHHAAASDPVRAALAALVAVALVGCGDSPTTSSSGIAWEGKPIVVRQPELPRDTIVSGTIANKGDAAVHLDATDVQLVTPDGDAVQSDVRFAVGITHQLYPPREGPKEKDPEFLRERLGEVANVEPGATVPLVVAWRLAPGQAAPVKVDLGASGSLALP